MSAAGRAEERVCGAAHPFTVVIPARYASRRFPGKPLADIAGKPMVVRVAERAARSGASAVLVATDDERIATAVRAHGIEVVRTRSDHSCGTDRIAEVADRLALKDDAIVVNVQGDEPLIDPAQVAAVARALASRDEAAVATLCHPIRRGEEIFNPNVVKVVLDARGFALYFSRAPIPYARDAWVGAADRLAPGSPAIAPDVPAGLPCYRHTGLYAYRAGFLRRYAGLAPSPLEAFEQLEQLRALWHGYRIAVAMSEAEALPGVDTPEDLARVRKLAASWV